MTENIKTVGRRVMPVLSFHASEVALKKAAAFNETLQAAFPYGKIICCAKGVYRFKSQEDANQHQEGYIAATMVKVNELNRIRARSLNNG